MATLREALESSVSDLEAAVAPTEDVTADPEPIPDLPAEQPETDLAPEKKSVDRDRDPAGKFAPKSKPDAAMSSGKAAQGKAEVAPSPTSATPAPAVSKAEVRAPQSWKPELREKWNAVPEEVRQEVVRREREVTVAMQEASEARRQLSSVQQMIAPYEGMIRAEGGHPIQAIGSLLQTAAALRTAPPAHKAQIVADLIKQYGIDHNMLADSISGAGPRYQQEQQYRDPRVDQLQQYIQQQEGQRQQARMAEGQRAVEEFAKSHEFLDDVRQDMAEFIQVAKSRGLTLSLEDAYSRAVELHPGIRDVLRQREEAKARAKANASTQRAKAATSSVRSEPARPGVKDGKPSLREQLDSAFSELSGR